MPAVGMNYEGQGHFETTVTIAVGFTFHPETGKYSSLNVCFSASAFIILL
jgi:hypothetical protein